MNPTYYLKAELKEDQHLSPNAQPSSSSSVSCHLFSNSCTHDHSKSYHWDIQQQPQNQQEAYDFASRGGSYKIEDEISESKINNIQVKWMSSKMRLMEKMKNSDRTAVNMPTSTTATAAAATAVLKLEDEKRSSSPLETENCSHSSSNNSNNQIRVCSDCNTTKTPLWRGGPKGPKSLCNACGIRQRKARRAIAVANGAIIATKTPPKKINKAQNSVAKLHKKSCKLAVTPSHSRKKLCFEDFLVSLSNNLACHRVFPQDEKEAAILLMALSCGHLHG